MNEPMVTDSSGSDEESVALVEQAVDRLFDAERSDGDYIFEPEDCRTAHAAILRLRERFAALPRVIAEALDGARSSGELLSSDRLQGLAEVFQNADDANASEVRLVLQEDDLLLGHNGDPVRLRHILGLATPWFSTKGHEAESFGRHGIGLSALRSLSKTVDVHCHPYHLRIGDPELSPIEPIELPAAFDGEDWTIFRVPISVNSVELEELTEWLNSWGDCGLLFLRSLQVVGLRAPDGETIRQLSVNREPKVLVQVADANTDSLVQRQFVKAPGGLSWMVYTTEVDSPKGISRVRKSKDAKTPVGVALPLHEALAGEVYAGLPVVETPLPVFVNAQFDPLTNRRNLADTEWNRALVPLVARIWAYAAVDLFSRSPEVAWRAMPVGLSRDQDAVPSLVGRLNEAILESARTSVSQGVAIEVSGEGWLALRELAVESEPLEGIVTAEETAALLGLRAALPWEARDSGGKWRTVLDDWRAAGSNLVEPLSVKRALDLLQNEERSVQATLELAAAGLREGLDDVLGTLPCLIAADGRRLVPPMRGSAEAIAEKVSPLGEELGIVTALHPAHLEDKDDARMVVEWLRERRALLAGTDDTVVLRRLAESGRLKQRLPEPLTDGQADALRKALELIDIGERSEIGRAVGYAIELAAYEYRPSGKEKRRRMFASPAAAYLPRSIDRGRDGFAVAAGKSPGIVWLEGRYRRSLRSTAGRAGIGAQKFLRLLGAETAPRPGPHKDLEQRYSGQQLGLPRLANGSPAPRSAELADQGATYTLADSACPEMIRVVKDIAAVRQGGKRRRRAKALLATLVRAWGRLSDFAEVVTAEDFYAWNKKGRTAAFWLWQARDVAWLDDENGMPRRPTELRIRTPGTEAIYGADSPDFLHSELLGPHPERGNWSAVMGALGMSGDPTRRELVARLAELRENTQSHETAMQSAAIIYRALAEALGDSPARSDLTKKNLRKAFEDGDGLIATKLGWQPPSKVLAGPAVFGTHFPFAPQVPETGRLWDVLRLRKPSLADCIFVLRRIARKGQLSLDDEAVQLETFRLLAETYYTSGRPEDRRKLRKMPLWTTQGWIKDRPVFATYDESLVDTLGASLAIWNPGGELEQFRVLLEPLRIDVIGSADAKVINAKESIEALQATQLFRAAVQQMREDLVRNDPSVAECLRGRWDDLIEFAVWSHPRLTLAVHVPESAGGGTRRCPAHVKVDVDGRKVFVRDPHKDLPRADRGGWAVAAMFDGERRRVAQAWGAAWDRAMDGLSAPGLELAQQKAEREEEEMGAEMDRQLQALRTRPGKRRAPGAGHKRRFVESEERNSVSSGTGSKAENSAKPRVLVDPESLAVVDPSGKVVGGSRTNTKVRSRRSGGLVDPRARRTRSPTDRKPIRGYSDQEREDVGFELARRVLSGKDQDIVDLRSQRGVGADAVDELERFYELKVSAGEEPKEVTLTDAEWKRANSSPDFFLVVVSGMEGSEATPCVRIIPKPLNQLKQRVSGTVILSGVQDAKSLRYDFTPTEIAPDKTQR